RLRPRYSRGSALVCAYPKRVRTFQLGSSPFNFLRRCILGNAYLRFLVGGLRSVITFMNFQTLGRSEMELLVTGGCGYVGSVCGATLPQTGHDVNIIYNFSTGNREAVAAKATFVEGDVADLAAEVL